MKKLLQNKWVSFGILALIGIGIGGIFTFMPKEKIYEAIYGAEDSQVIIETIHSKALGRDSKASIYLPKGYKSTGSYPVVYWFHGHGAIHSQMLYDGGGVFALDQLIEDQTVRPMIIVCPQVDASYGVNSGKENKRVTSKDGTIYADFGQYEDYILQEVIPTIENKYAISKKREDRTIAGFSMGGHIALRLGFDHKDQFGKIAAHSPAIKNHDTILIGVMKDLLYPTEDLLQKRNPVLMADYMDLKGLKVSLDIGESDSPDLISGCKDLEATLKKHGVTVEFHLNLGGHNMKYLNDQMTTYIEFYNSPAEKLVEK